MSIGRLTVGSIVLADCQRRYTTLTSHNFYLGHSALELSRLHERELRVHLRRRRVERHAATLARPPARLRNEWRDTLRRLRRF